MITATFDNGRTFTGTVTRNYPDGHLIEVVGARGGKGTFVRSVHTGGWALVMDNGKTSRVVKMKVA